MEEWAEAALFSHWLSTGSILSFSELEERFNVSLEASGGVKSGEAVKCRITE